VRMDHIDRSPGGEQGHWEKLDRDVTALVLELAQKIQDRIENGPRPGESV
jgi:hypothetical protein